MPVPVYAWPPVPAIGTEWSVVAPISESVSLITGKRFTSAAQPSRRVAQMVVGALGRGPIYDGRMGAGYVEVLKRLLAGGANLVRLNSYPINWFLDQEKDAAVRQSLDLTWRDGSVPLDWTMPSTELLWYDGTILTGTLTTSLGFPSVTVTGLPPSRLVARPGEYVTAFQNEDDAVGSTRQVMAPAYSNAGGSATIRLMSALAYGGRVNIGTSESAVFRVVGELPRAVSSMLSDWSYAWQFEEVFSAEVGGFTEVTNWWTATGPVPS